MNDTCASYRTHVGDADCGFRVGKSTSHTKPTKKAATTASNQRFASQTTSISVSVVAVQYTLGALPSAHSALHAQTNYTSTAPYTPRTHQHCAHNSHPCSRSISRVCLYCLLYLVSCILYLVFLSVGLSVCLSEKRPMQDRRWSRLVATLTCKSFVSIGERKTGKLCGGSLRLTCVQEMKPARAMKVNILMCALRFFRPVLKHGPTR